MELFIHSPHLGCHRGIICKHYRFTVYWYFSNQVFISYFYSLLTAIKIGQYFAEFFVKQGISLNLNLWPKPKSFSILLFKLKKTKKKILSKPRAKMLTISPIAYPAPTMTLQINLYYCFFSSKKRASLSLAEGWNGWSYL